jgi:hypothetical protein
VAPHSPHSKTGPQLLRAQGGSDDALLGIVPAGARVVLLDRAVTAVPLGPDDVAVPLVWRFGPAGRPLTSRAYRQATHAFSGRSFAPASPVHVRATRSTLGDITLTWIRRTRVGGDAWGRREVPLGEESEDYEVEILDGTSVVRSLKTGTPAVLYTAAQQTADFGAPQPSLSVRVFQLGGLGRGVARQATL